MYLDLKTDPNVITDIRLPEERVIYLQMNTDGGRLQFSSKSVWPVTFAVLNLPPHRRSKFDNIILGALWMGQGKPDWNDFLVKIIQQLADLKRCGLHVDRPYVNCFFL